VTGRKLYDALTDAWANAGSYDRHNGEWIKPTPPAWLFLTSAERRTFTRAAVDLTPRPRPRRG
jgi:hypothetical protein